MSTPSRHRQILYQWADELSQRLPLTKPQAEWIYGDSIENIVSTVREGRPKGMPSFRGKLPDDQIWEVAAYVHSLVDGAPEPAGE